MLPNYIDVVVIGAGPAGTIAAALLQSRGFNVLILEKAQFPRFSIGESLLPQSMEFMQQAGLLPIVQQAGFQFKNGAAFTRGDETGYFDFEDKFSPGWGTTFQVERSHFDQLLADEVATRGVDIRYQHEVIEFYPGAQPELVVLCPDATQQRMKAGFVLDASGFGRVLSRLLNLETPSNFPLRSSVFSHFADHIDDPHFDRNKILITVHPEKADVWIWLIPLSADKCSLGVVGLNEVITEYGSDASTALLQILEDTPSLKRLLPRAEMLFPARHISGYACNVSSLCGEGFALLGNAGEFLDPVFSSGVTIAMKSAVLAAEVLERQRSGETVDWVTEYEQPLKLGIDTFRCYVEAWYDGRLQDIIFSTQQDPTIKKMICSILAGYAWDSDNPYVHSCARRLSVLAQICK